MIELSILYKALLLKQFKFLSLKVRPCFLEILHIQVHVGYSGVTQTFKGKLVI